MCGFSFLLKMCSQLNLKRFNSSPLFPTLSHSPFPLVSLFKGFVDLNPQAVLKDGFRGMNSQGDLRMPVAPSVENEG